MHKFFKRNTRSLKKQTYRTRTYILIKLSINFLKETKQYNKIIVRNESERVRNDIINYNFYSCRITTYFL